MSHFTVAVLTLDGSEQSIEDVMLRYHEFECTGLEIHIQEIDDTEDHISDYLTRTKNMIKLSDGSLLEPDNELFMRPATQSEIDMIEDRDRQKDIDFKYRRSYGGGDDDVEYKITEIFPAGSVNVEIKYCDEMSFLEYISYWDEMPVVKLGEKIDIANTCKYGYLEELLPSEVPESDDMLTNYLDTENNSLIYGKTEEEITAYLKAHYKIIHRTNPDSQWDWYQIGGRWKGMLRLKAGGTSNSAKLSDIDFSMDQKVYDKSIRFWEVAVEDSPLKDGEDKNNFRSFYRKEYYQERFGSKENYAKEQAEFGTFALVDLDGEWHQKGDMGWFGLSDDTEESSKTFMEMLNEKIAGADPNAYLTIVDCHI